jgi:hypothetical protein
VGITDGTLAGTAGALLPPRFDTAAAHFGAGQRALGALPLIGKQRGNNLVHGRLVHLNAENGVGKLRFAYLCAFRIIDSNLWHFAFPP